MGKIIMGMTWGEYLKYRKKKYPELYRKYKVNERQKRISWYNGNGKPTKAPPLKE